MTNDSFQFRQLGFLEALGGPEIVKRRENALPTFPAQRFEPFGGRSHIRDYTAPEAVLCQDVLEPRWGEWWDVDLGWPYNDSGNSTNLIEVDVYLFVDIWESPSLNGGVEIGKIEKNDPSIGSQLYKTLAYFSIDDDDLSSQWGWGKPKCSDVPINARCRLRFQQFVVEYLNRSSQDSGP